MIYIYKLIGFLLIPIIKINIYLRIKKRKEIKSRYKERYGISNYKFNNKKKTIWIHAASLGEFKSSHYIIEKYNLNYNILITTTTVSAAEYAIKIYGNKIIHQYAPLDIDIWINIFLNNWKPNFIIWIESDLWPNTLHNIKKRSIKSILVNLRLSPKSLKRWKLLPFFYNNLINCFDEVFVQSRLDEKRIKEISSRPVQYIGNLKLTYPFKKNKKNKIAKNSKLNYLMLASSHPKEEIFFMPLIKKFLKEYDGLRIIIAPRHPERSDEIKSICTSFNLGSQFHSEEKNGHKKIIIIDSFGVLTDYFIKSDIVFLGGSLISAGGHNPIEPALHECAILTGPHIFNWENIYYDMIQNNACLKTQSIEEVEISLKNLLDNKKKIECMKINALKFSQEKFFDTISLDNTINKYLTKC